MKNLKRISVAVLSVSMMSMLLVSCGSNTSSSQNNKNMTTEKTEEAANNDNAPAVEETQPTLVSIKASYSGKTKKGTVLDENNDGIEVTATYDDDSSDKVDDWTVETAKKLKAGKTTTIKINYRDASCKLKVKCTSKTKKQYQESCKEIAYNDLARKPDKYEGKNIKIYGEVIQVMEDGDDLTLRVATKNSGYGYYDDVVLVAYTYKDNDDKVLEDDMITCWGKYGNTYTYESTMGGNITVPLLYAKYIKISD